jgi:hypothetical protein
MLPECKKKTTNVKKKIKYVSWNAIDLVKNRKNPVIESNIRNEANMFWLFHTNHNL